MAATVLVMFVITVISCDCRRRLFFVFLFACSALVADPDDRLLGGSNLQAADADFDAASVNVSTTSQQVRRVGLI